MQPYYLDRPLVMAHRGARDVAPENTVAAFRAAARPGRGRGRAGHHPLRLGEIVVLHDDTVDRTSNGSGRVDSLTLRRAARTRRRILVRAALCGRADTAAGRGSGCRRWADPAQHRDQASAPGMQPIETELAEYASPSRSRPRTRSCRLSTPGAIGVCVGWRRKIPRALLYSRDMPFGLRHAWPRYWLAPAGAASPLFHGGRALCRSRASGRVSRQCVDGQ